MMPCGRHGSRTGSPTESFSALETEITTSVGARVPPSILVAGGSAGVRRACSITKMRTAAGRTVPKLTCSSAACW